MTMTDHVIYLWGLYLVFWQWLGMFS